jgi:diguanylate cyclase (GGDEF)-like protein
MPVLEPVRIADTLKWIALQTIALLALVIPSTWFLANYFCNFSGLVSASDVQATVHFITVLTGAEMVLFYPLVAIPMSMSLRQAQDARERLQKLADTDSLTGLLNRRGFAEAVEARCRNLDAAAPVAALVVDIDAFKGVNDQHGHEFGDAVLCDLASLISDSAEANGALAARYGGEEFILFAPGLTRHDALAIAVSLRSGFQARRLEFHGATVNCTISIGVANAEAPCDLTSLISRADAALYAAKRAGKNRVVEDRPSARPVAA